MQSTSPDILKKINPRRIVWPILIGLGVVCFMSLRNFDIYALQNVKWTWDSTYWLLLALLMLFVRDFAYMIRIRVLTKSELNWRSSFEVIMLWEFASAVAPAILGGGFAFAIYILSREKVKLGKSISVIMFTSFLDGLFFALVAPLVYFTLGKEQLFASINHNATQQVAHGQALYYTFWVVYFVILAWKLLVAYALFINARAVKKTLINIFSLRLLRRWRYSVMETGTELVIASRELKKENFYYWIKAFAATWVSWTARFIIINCIISAFTDVPVNHYLLYGRQVVMGILTIVSPTPGGSGAAELAFANFLGEFIGNASMTIALAMLWRLISYYPYFLVGFFVLPRWVKRVFASNENLPDNK